MSLNARFSADFSQFQSAVDKAQVHVQAFQTGVNTVARDMSKMADSFSGQKIVAEATRVTSVVQQLGGVEKLTAAEQDRVNVIVSEAIEKYTALGLTAPPALTTLKNATLAAKLASDDWSGRNTITLQQMEQMGIKATGVSGGLGLIQRVAAPLGGVLAGAFTVRAIASFIGDVVQAGDHLGDLSDRTGMSASALQALERQGAPAGVTLDMITDSAEQLGIRLAHGDSSAVSAVEKLGFNLDAVKQMRADERYVAIADALGEIPDPAQRAALAVDLMGRQGRDAAAMMTSGFAAAHESIKDSAAVMSDEEIKLLSTVNDEWEAFAARGKVFGAHLITGFIEGAKLPSDWFSLAIGVDDIDATVARVQADAQAIAASVKPILEALKDPAARGAEAWKSFAQTQAKAYQQFRSLTDVQRTNIEVMAKAGVSVEDLARDFEVSVPAIQMVIDRDKLLSDQRGKLTAITDKATAAERVQREEHEKAIKDISQDLTGAKAIQQAKDYLEAIGPTANVLHMNAEQQQRVADVMRAGVEALVLSGKATDGLSSKFTAMGLAATQGQRDADAMAAALKKQADEAAADAAASANLGVVIVGGLSPALQKARDDANQANESVKSFGEAMDLVRAGKGTLSGTVQNAQLTADSRAAIQRAYNQGNYFGPVIGGGPGNPHGIGPDYAALGFRASGGDVEAGRAYVVGEERPEVFVPRTAGTIVPRVPDSGGVVIHIAVDARESNFDTPEGVNRLAKKVSAAALAQLTSRGRRVA